MQAIHLEGRYEESSHPLAVPVVVFNVVPILAVSPAVEQQGKSARFDVSTEFHLQTIGWGPNSFRFECGKEQVSLELQQSK